jgi:glycerol-3-phosphate dehydrogenase subunit C
MREGSLEAPTRHPIPWQDPDFYDIEKLDAEMRRVLDICHGCRRCFNLCDSFPRLFDLVDAAPSEELDTVKSEDFKPIVDACTLCDLCFMTKCPYVPPHEFNLDFPHLMLRYRAVEQKLGKGPGTMATQLTETDRNGKLAGMVAPIANWASDLSNTTTANTVTISNVESINTGASTANDTITLGSAYTSGTIDLAAGTTVELSLDPTESRTAAVDATASIR